MKIFYLVIAFFLMIPLLPPGYLLFLDFQVGPNSFSYFDDFYGYESNPYGATLPFRIVFAALADFIPLDILEKLLLFFILFLCGASMHSALPEKYGNARYFGGLFYLLNPFVFVRFLAGHWTLVLSYALWPLAIKFFIEFMQKPDRKNIIKTAIMTFLASVSIHGLLLLLIVYLVLFAMNFRRKILKKTILLGLAVIVLNLFWMVPAILLFDYSPVTAESYLEDFGANDSLSIASLHGFWRGGFTYTMDVFDFWIIPFLLIFTLAAFGFSELLKENAPIALSSIIIFAIAVLLALGNSSPLFFLLEPVKDILFFAFRDTQKFAGLIALVYAFLGSYAAYRVSGNRKLVFAIILLPIIYNFGFFGFLGQMEASNYPDDWNQAEKIMSADQTEGNMLILPPHLYKEHKWINGTQKTAGSGVYEFFSRPFITSLNIETSNIKSDRSDPYSDYIDYMFENRQFINNTAEYLLPLNVRYIILFKDDVDTPHYLHLFYRYGGVENIEMIYQSSSFYLFRNNLATGKLYSFDREGAYGSVEYHQIHPARFEISGSDYENIVFTKKSTMEFNGKSTIPHNEISQTFPFSRGLLVNPIHNLILFLFLLSWFLILVLVLDLKPANFILLAITFILAYLIVDNGFAMPNHIGWLIIFSLILVFLQKKPTFINL